MAVKPRVARDDGRYAVPGGGGACWAVAVAPPRLDWTYVILRERRDLSVETPNT